MPSSPPSPGGEDEIYYEVVLTAEFSKRFVEHRVDGAHKAPAGSPSRLDYTATAEALLLHARNIVELLSAKPRSDTYSALSFSSMWDLAACASRLSGLDTRLNKELSHLDVNRSPRDWSPIKIVEQLLDEYDAFLQTMDRRSSGAGERKLCDAGLASRAALEAAKKLADEHSDLVGEHRP